MVVPLGAGLDARTRPNVGGAVARLADKGQEMWQAYAAGGPLPDGKRIHSRSGAYLKSIHVRQLGELSYEVYSDLPYADAIERGSPARDLKRMLDTSAKVRMSKAGKRYLIIPFQWGTPGTIGFGANVMPESIHEIARRLSPSRIIGSGSRASGHGAYDVVTRKPIRVEQRLYQKPWGDRLQASAISAAGVHGMPQRRMAGMVKMQGHDQKGSKQTSYLTFRNMVEGSPGWLAPAREGLWPARTVARKLFPAAEEVIKAAVAADVQAYLGWG
jgi:hypothetical protein